MENAEIITLAYLLSAALLLALIVHSVAAARAVRRALTRQAPDRL